MADRSLRVNGSDDHFVVISFGMADHGIVQVDFSRIGEMTLQTLIRCREGPSMLLNLQLGKVPPWHAPPPAAPAKPAIGVSSRARR